MSAGVLPLVRALPLTPGQERLLAGDRVAASGIRRRLENIAVRVEGPLDVEALQQALDLVVRRHEALTATIRARTDGVPMQLIQRQRVLIERRDVPDADPAVVTTAPARRPSDRNLLHVEVAKLGRERHVVSLAIHHAISDGWSVVAFLKELSEAYRAAVTGESPRFVDVDGAYSSACERLRKRRWDGSGDVQRAYWTEELSSPWTPIGLPGVPGLSRTVADAPLAAVRSPRTALAAIALALYAEAGATDLRIGTLVPCRTAPGLQHLLGFFANTVVIRLRIDPAASLEALEAHANQKLAAALARQDTPIQDIIRDLENDPGFTPLQLYEVMFSFETMRRTLAIEGARCSEVLSPVPSPRTAPTTVALRWQFELSDGVSHGALTYAAERVDRPTAARLSARFRRAAALLGENPGMTVGDGAAWL